MGKDPSTRPPQVWKLPSSFQSFRAEGRGAFALLSSGRGALALLSSGRGALALLSSWQEAAKGVGALYASLKWLFLYNECP